MAEQDKSDRLLVAFLRNLSSGFTSYQLFGGDINQTGFEEAVNRIANVSESALATGTVRVRVHGDRFITESEPLPDDEAYRRLAMACYERRVEEISLATVPTKQELAALYNVLSTAIEELDDAGGAPRLLTAKGVASIQLNEALVRPTTGDDIEGVLPQLDALTLGIEEIDELSQDLMRDPRSADAESVYRLLREVVTALPPEVANDPDTYSRLRDAVDRLPEEVRGSLSSILIANVRGDEVAERLIGTMTDTGLAQLLVDVSRQVGGDPIDLARELVVGGFRRHDLIELAAAASTNGPAALPDPPEGVGGERTTLLEVVATLTSTELETASDEDRDSIRLDWPDTDDEQRDQALVTFSDYLRVEDDLERLDAVLQSWTRATRGVLEQGDRLLAERLIEVADLAHETVSAQAPDRARLILDAKARILDEELALELATQGMEGDGSELLSRFGPIAAQTLLRRLAEEQEGTRRSTLIGILAGLVPEHPSVLDEWIMDNRWFVVRNVMTIIHRSGTSSGMVELIEAGISHPHPTVRKEAVRALAPAGADALPKLVALSGDSDRDVALTAVNALGSVALIAAEGEARAIGSVVRSSRDSEVRKRALRLLARHPSDEATEVLDSIARFGSKPRAPFAIRRQAKALARERKGRP